MHLRIPNLVGDRGEPFLTVSEYLGTTHVQNKEQFGDLAYLIKDVNSQAKVSLRSLETTLRDLVSEEKDEADRKLQGEIGAVKESLGGDLEQTKLRLE